jgi:hypothetical protein
MSCFVLSCDLLVTLGTTKKEKSDPAAKKEKSVVPTPAATAFEGTAKKEKDKPVALTPAAKKEKPVAHEPDTTTFEALGLIEQLCDATKAMGWTGLVLCVVLSCAVLPALICSSLVWSGLIFSCLVCFGLFFFRSRLCVLSILWSCFVFGSP